MKSKAGIASPKTKLQTQSLTFKLASVLNVVLIFRTSDVAVRQAYWKQQNMAISPFWDNFFQQLISPSHKFRAIDIKSVRHGSTEIVVIELSISVVL